mmetsp:Transcript_8253/g.19226  ORF Transcript_8253/g.19226 Transcript_8253/m.19226 type:complete len:487 (-) Transcript_8253:121-1581(-)
MKEARKRVGQGEGWTRVEVEVEAVNLCKPESFAVVGDDGSGDCQPGLGERAGALVFTGGLYVKSVDPRLGGWSGLRLGNGRGEFVALEDEGYLIQGVFIWGGSPSRLKSATNVSLGTLLSPSGVPLNSIGSGKAWSDAEGLASVHAHAPFEEGVFVSFEREGRVWKYPSVNGTISLVPQAIGLDNRAEITSCEYNGGLEALESVQGVGLIFICEDVVYESQTHDGGAGTGTSFFGAVRGWVYSGILDSDSEEQLSPFRYLVRDGLSPVAAAKVPGTQDILVLERTYKAGVGNTLRIRYISRATIREAEASDCIVDGSLVGELNPEVHYTDNFEGMDIVAGAAGGMEVVIVSDDNFNHAQQRTLIYSFSLDSTMLLPSSCMPAISFKAALQSGEPHQNTSSGWQLLLPIIFFLGLLAAAIAYVVHRRRKYMFQQMRGDDDIELQQDSQKGEGRRTAGGGGEDSTASPMLGEGTDGAVGEDEEQPSRS